MLDVIRKKPKALVGPTPDVQANNNSSIMPRESGIAGGAQVASGANTGMGAMQGFTNQVSG